MQLRACMSACFKGIVSQVKQPGRLRFLFRPLEVLATVVGFKGQTGAAVTSNGEIGCLAHQMLPVSDEGWQLRAPATGRTPPGLMSSFGCQFRC